MSRNVGIAQASMLGSSRSHTLTPHLERAALHFVAHQGNDSRFIQAKLRLDGLERRAVFPRHFNDSGRITRVEEAF